MKISYERSNIHQKKNIRNMYISIAMVIVSLLIRFATVETNHNNNVGAEAFRIVGEGVLENASVNDTATEIFECISVYSENSLIEVFKNNVEKFEN